MQLETDKELPFLDLKITRRLNKIEFSIFRKPTTTDHVIPYFSTHPLEHKTSSFRSLLSRLFSIPMSDKDFQKELDIIKVIAHRNGYTQQHLKQIYNKIDRRVTQKNITKLQNNREGKQYFTISYIPDISDKIRHFFKHQNIYISFRTPSNLKYLFCNIDDPQDPLLFSGVYRVE